MRGQREEEGEVRGEGKYKANIPQDRRTELENVLLEYFKVEAVDDDVIKAASECSWLSENEGYIPHSRAVVQYFIEVCRMKAFL